MKLYKVEFGNGYNGSRSNLGTVLVIAENVPSARKAVKEQCRFLPGQVMQMSVIISEEISNVT